MLLGLAAVVIAASRSLAVAFGALFLALGGFAVLAPQLGVIVLGMLRRIAPRRLPARALALLLAGEKRIRPALAALSLALALAAGLAMMVLGFRAAVDDWIDRLLSADAYVTASQGALDRTTVERVTALPGIETTSSAHRVRLDDGRDLIAYDLPPRAWAGFELAGRRCRSGIRALSRRPGGGRFRAARAAAATVGRRYDHPGHARRQFRATGRGHLSRLCQRARQHRHPRAALPAVVR
ncbi:MAG: hypothetical protein U5L08_15975 [Xanthomonadales bacterium]|nr:hypothetical protein [Xanthomonadales bacterium]